MYSRMLGVLPANIVDQAAADAMTLEESGYTSAYEEYSVGAWRVAPLWSDPSGPITGELVEHGQSAEPGLHIRNLDGINTLISTFFDVSYVRSARLFRASHGAMIIPHRDYLEHRFGFMRFHVPLRTHLMARNTEDDSCYHMRRGEVWYLDGRRIHSGGVLSAEPRVHLVVDFPHNMRPGDCLATEVLPAPAPHIIDRPPLPGDLLERYRAISPYVDPSMWQDLIHILSRVHLRYQANAGAVYDWLEDIALTANDRELLLLDVNRMRRYYFSDGPTRTETFDSIWSLNVLWPHCVQAALVVRVGSSSVVIRRLPVRQADGRVRAAGLALSVRAVRSGPAGPGGRQG